MGIRFTCHHCSYAVHVKDFQGGKRGKCPHCNKSFRIPLESADYSIPILDGQSESIADAPARSTSVVATKVQNTIAIDVQKTSDVAKQDHSVHAASQFEAPAPNGSTIKQPAGHPSSSPDRTERAFSPPTAPIAFASAPNAAWYVRPPSGGQYGPADRDLLTQWIQENRVTGDSLLWRDGQSQWIPSAELLPELYSDEHAPQANTPLNGRGGTEPSNAPVDVSFTIARPSLVTPSSSAANLTAQRKLRKRRQQWIVISFLALISLCLCTGLIIVLFR